MRLAATGLAGVAALALTALPVTQAAGSGSSVGLNVVLNTDLTPAIVSELSGYGTVNELYSEIDGLTMRVASSAVSKVARLPYVESATKDVPLLGGPVESSPFDTTADGIATWNTDMIDVYENGVDDERVVPETGAGVYVAVLDTGLHSSWPYYFGEERIATEYAVSFGGGGGERGTVNTQPHKWSQDQNGHGTHVTSTILGYNLGGTAVGGVAPDAKVIPVKVLNQNGNGWSSVVTAGINYVTDLVVEEGGELEGAPMVINMSLGGPAADPLMTAAIDRAIAAGVLVVAAAGNSGPDGTMDYPGAQEEVISVAAAGWTQQWTEDTWFTSDVDEPTPASQVFIAPYSSRQGDKQSLDIAAPGAFVLGPYQTDGRIGYSYLTGTSMAAPHVAGALALMLEASPGLGQTRAEDVLEASALRLGTCLPDECTLEVAFPVGTGAVNWDTDATGAGLLDVDAALEHLKTGATVTSSRGENSGKGRQ